MTLVQARLALTPTPITHTRQPEPEPLTPNPTPPQPAHEYFAEKLREAMKVSGSGLGSATLLLSTY